MSFSVEGRSIGYFQFRQLGERPVLIESSQAGCYRIDDLLCLQGEQSVWGRGDVPDGSRHDGAASDEVAGRIVMKGDGELSQSLEELLISLRRGTPCILEHFVGLEESFRVKQPNSALNFASVLSILRHHQKLT